MEQADEKKLEPEGAGPAVSVVNADIVIEGNLTATHGLQMEGRIVGDVRCSTLLVGEKGTIQGTIRADRVRIMGDVEGGIETKDLAIEPTGRVTGDINYERIKIATGAVIQGNLRCTAPDQKGNDANKLKLVQSGTPKPAAKDPTHVYIE